MQGKYKNLIKCIFLIAIAFIICNIVFMEANAATDYSEALEITRTPTIIITDGQEVSLYNIANKLLFNGQPLYNKIGTGDADFQLSINGKTISKKSNKSNITETVKLSVGAVELEGTLTVKYTNLSTNQPEQTVLPFIIRKNTPPTVTTQTIYVTAEDLNVYKTIPNDSPESLKSYILQHITVYDFENNEGITVDVFGHNGKDFDVNEFNAGNTVLVYVTVTDYNVTVTVPCNIVCLLDEQQEQGLSQSYIRAITLDYFPYHRKDAVYDDGYYYAKLSGRPEDGKLYYIDKNGDFLLNKNGEKYPVDACLTVKLVDVGEPYETYQVLPYSKWLTNGNCMTLLTNCLLNDGSEYIQSWTFSKEDIRVIQDVITEGGLDDNFYFNYYSNGYCQNGTRKPNESNRVENYNIIYDESGNDTGLVWYVLNKTLYITGKSEASKDYSYEIPNYKVKTPITGAGFNVEANAYKDKTMQFIEGIEYTFAPPWKDVYFEQVIFDNRVTQIGDYAFAGKQSLVSALDIPENCRRIGTGAFINCINIVGDLKTKQVYEICDYAFANCNRMNGKLSLGNNALNKIGNAAFYNAGFTSSLTVPSSVKSVGAYAFANCKYLSGNLSLSENISDLGAYAFAGCVQLDGDLRIPNALKVIKEGTFAHCCGFNGNLQLNSNLTKIEPYAFYNCYNLIGELWLPENLTRIEYGAFKDCRNLAKTIHLNNKLTHIGTEAFSGCINITTIDNANENKNLTFGRRVFFVSTSVVTNMSLRTYVDSQSGEIVSSNTFKYNFMGDNRPTADT